MVSNKATTRWCSVKEGIKHQVSWDVAMAPKGDCKVPSDIRSWRWEQQEREGNRPQAGGDYTWPNGSASRPKVGTHITAFWPQQIAEKQKNEKERKKESYLMIIFRAIKLSVNVYSVRAYSDQSASLSIQHVSVC